MLYSDSFKNRRNPLSRADAHSCQSQGGVAVDQFLGGGYYEDGNGYEWNAVCRVASGTLEPAVAAINGRIVEERTPSLDDIFVANGFVTNEDTKDL